MTGYGSREVSRMLGLSVGQLRSYVRAGFLKPARGPRGELRFTFQDLVLLRTAQGLVGARIAPRRVRAALRKLRSELPEGRTLRDVHIRAEGDRIVVGDGARKWSAEDGQVLFDFGTAELARRIAPLARKRSPSLDADGLYERGCDLEEVDPAAARAATWAGCCTRRARRPARRSTTGAPSRSGPRTAPPRSTSASPWRTWGGARRPSTRTGWRSPPTRTAPTRTTTSRASTSTWGKERRRCATCARTARSPATPDARPVRDERLQLRAVARPVLPGGPAEDEDAPVLCVSLRHGGDQLQLLPQADRAAARRLGGAGAGALPLRAQGLAAHHAPHAAARAGAGLGVRGRGPGAGPATRADPVPAAADPESGRAAPAGLPPSPAARPAGRVRVPPRELVRRRHLPRAAGLRRRPVPRRERRAGHAARAHRSVRVPAAAPYRVRRGAAPRLGGLGARRGIRAGRVLLLQARGRGARPALRPGVADAAACLSGYFSAPAPILARAFSSAIALRMSRASGAAGASWRYFS